MSESSTINIQQSVAILIDGNNIELSLQSLVGRSDALINFDSLIPKLLQKRGLSRLIYFREGKSISNKLAERLLTQYHGSVVPCHKSADIPLTITATQIAPKVHTIIILSGDADYVELVSHLKREGVRVEIAAIEQTTSRHLIEVCDHFTAITQEDCFLANPRGNIRRTSSSSLPKPVRDKSSANNAASKSTPKPPSKSTTEKKKPVAKKEPAPKKRTAPKREAPKKAAAPKKDPAAKKINASEEAQKLRNQRTQKSQNTTSSNTNSKANTTNRKPAPQKPAAKNQPNKKTTSQKPLAKKQTTRQPAKRNTSPRRPRNN